LIGLIALPLIAIGAYFWATGMIGSLMAYRSPLANTPPAPGEAVGQPMTRKVVIVLMDALRLDTSENTAVMPFLSELRTQGSFATMTSRPPSFSAPGWGVLLTGAWPDLNDTDIFNPDDEYSARVFTQDDIFAAADRSGLKTAVSGYSWFEQMLANSGVDDGFYTPEEDNAADREVVDAALPWLSSDYQLVLIHIDQIDYAGHHEGGPRGPNWNAAATRADALLREIVSKMDLSQDTIIVLADHGQIDIGGHGGTEAVTMTEPFVIAGKGVLAGATSEVQMVDVAPTVAVLLGTNIPASNQGRPLYEFLDVSAERITAINAIVKTQQDTLFNSYTSAIGQTTTISDSEAVVSSTQIAMERARMTRLSNERIWRNLVAVFLAVLPGYMLVLRREKKLLWLLGGALVYILLFNLRYAVLDGKTYSISSIPGQNEFILYVAVTAAVSVAAGWLVAMFGLRVWRTGPLTASRAALGYVWMVLYLIALPILLNFAVNGVIATWTLPVFNVQFFGFFNVVQALFVAAVGLLLIGITALVAKFTKRT
jgi:predicted AlkP superfamily pyrophosphatase or phosphodiesterase